MSQQTATSHKSPNGLDELIRIAATQPLSPDCDHFYFLRHGQTGRNALRIFQAVDEPLSELGLQQAARAATLLAGEPIRTVVCSDARRANDTAYAVATALNLVPAAQATLRERNFGALIGTSSANIDWACEPEGGETLTQFVARTREAIDTALRLPAPALVVAHGGTLYALAALLGVPVDLGLLGNAQPLRFERRGPTWAVTPLLRHADGDAALA
ncbi:histidine phosphatase family protein [Variovorax sp. NFACC27]|jgi:probable phosphoglycerate mutase|uniref:histidine phosphatase family protein n=1 Tax=unclassified Variovorax TaxID=663243 RepID=UPI000897EB18|nr:histidine phosphatase family protein [Variovorax sp. YR750]SEF32105.1 probable phosphoglycerate mutase [Variovorax sp. NFACC28]SEG91632.1 probable phosphoglycerate mutase [Variovorax sp. NFACC29]SFD50912.1 probable phosphoglycerate mutase [Variovorax sp. NFACC26]SFG71823.1 probable phosphoglycerate mutase [Variovorax sp. NFACC27]SEL43259.1 probable phosphoglycerate mutase [Variovorax sp. YR750]